MDSKRVFIAIEINPEIRHKLDEFILQLKVNKIKSVRWVPIDNIHLTLKFIGEIDINREEQIIQVLKKVTLGQKPFTVEVCGSGVFPNIRKPRVIWVGIKAPLNLAKLHQELDQDLSILGLPPEKGEFTPHLTIARISQNSTETEYQILAHALSRIQADLMGAFPVKSVALFQSILSPAGAVYHALARINFGDSRQSMLK
jgi:2'-5' RNA ligase